jgi:Family of unknown function (DUF6529)
VESRTLDLMTGPPPLSAPGPWQTRLLVAAVAGAAISILLGVYGRVHDPAGQQTVTAFFGTTLAFKAWMATVVITFAVIQLLTALRMWGKISWPSSTPPWFGQVHRLSGTLAFLATLPVAYHCLWAIGFEPDIDQPRRFFHSLFGCFFYGAFVVKIFAVRASRLPGRLLPIIGGIVFTSLVALWLTSSVWFFTTVGFPGF